MKILVCAKRVLDTTDANLKMDPVRGTLIKDGVPSILNPDDANALEAALAIKDENPDTTVTVLTMGAPAGEIMIRECLAMGADDAYFLSDSVFGGADTYATSITLEYGIRKIGPFDLILAGRQSIVGDYSPDWASVGTETWYTTCNICTEYQNTEWQSYS